MSMNDEFAIIGAAIDIAYIKGLEDFWESIKNKNEQFRDFPVTRKQDTDAYMRYSNLKTDTRKYVPGAYLERIDQFDYSFFHISPKEAKLMDPNQRLLLENAYKAVENAGYGGKALKGKSIGVYVAYNANMQLYHNAVNLFQPEMKELAFAGNESSVIAGRIANFLDVNGPAVMLDCACSSSLMALHTAMLSLKNGDCDAALVCAVSIKMLLLDDIENIGTVAKDYRTRTFDRFADGTGPGEGVISILIKPYMKAIDDGDAIYAVIKGSAVNHNGHTLGILAPSSKAQKDVIMHAWEVAKVNPEDIGFIEAHGTATRLGDPVEILSLRRAFEEYTQRKQFCGISSIKTNFGHLKSAAGLAGLLKCVMAIKNKEIPPTNNFQYPNHQIDFHKSALYVNDKTREWTPSDNGYICGISSFGINGTNCHIVLRNHDEPCDRKVNRNKKYLFVLSAMTIRSIRCQINRFVKYLNTHQPNMENLCFTLQTGRGHYQHRLAIIVENVEQLKEKLLLLLSHPLYKKMPNDTIYNYNRKIDLKKINTNTFSNLSLLEIAELYCKGYEIPWNNMYKTRNVKRIHLPEYEFDKRRCWVYDNINFEKYEVYENTYSIDTKFTNTSTNIGSYTIALIANIDKLGDEKAIIDFYEKRLKTKCLLVNKEDENIKNTIARYLNVKIETSFNKYIKVIYVNLSKSYKSSKMLYNILQTIINLKNSDRIDSFFYVSSQENSIEMCNNTNYAYPYGIIKAAVWEIPQTNFRLVDIGKWYDIDCLINEIVNKTTDLGIYDNRSFSVIYREGKRYYEVLRKKNTLQKRNKVLQLKEKGVYIITGGLGGIGMIVAEFLLSRGALNIAIWHHSNPETSLSKQYDAQIIKIKKWNANGANVIVMGVDITIKKNVRKAIGKLRDEYGNINGIFHCATNSKGGAILNSSYEEYIERTKPKILGCNYLAEYTRDDLMDFFVLFSSAITVIGGYGSASYITANQYLRVFAHNLCSIGRNASVIQWPAWLDVGLAKKNKIIKERELFRPINTNVAVWVLENILLIKLNSCIAGEINHNSSVLELNEKLPFMYHNASLTKNYSVIYSNINHVTLLGRDDECYTNQEIYIGDIWGQFLEMDEFDIDDNFFEVGGDSINATRLVKQIQSDCNITFDLHDFLTNITIRKQAKAIEKIKNNDIEEPIDTSLEIYPASSAQRRMFIHNYMNSDSLIYNLPEAIEILGNIDVYKMIRVIKKILKEHSIFSTELCIHDMNIVQKLRDIEFEIEIKDICESKVDTEIKAFVKPFCLNKPGNFRCMILRVDFEHHIIVYDIHHALFDGVSRDIFFKSLLYGYLGKKIIHPQVQYTEYAMNQYIQKDNEKISVQKKYWIEKMQKNPFLLKPSRALELFDENKGKRRTFYIKQESLDKIDKFIRQTAGTFFTFILAIYNMVCHEITGNNYNAIATPVEGRTEKKYDKTMGMFVNTIVLLNEIKQQERFIDYYKRIVNNTMKDLSNQDYQFDDLISDLKLTYDGGQFPLFETMLVLQERTFAYEYSVEKLKISSRKLEINRVKFPSILEAVILNDCVEFHYDFCTTVINDEEAKSICERFIKLIDKFISNPNSRIQDILISKEKTLQTENEIFLNFNMEGNEND